MYYNTGNINTILLWRSCEISNKILKNVLKTLKKWEKNWPKSAENWPKFEELTKKISNLGRTDQKKTDQFLYELTKLVSFLTNIFKFDFRAFSNWSQNAVCWGHVTSSGRGQYENVDHLARNTGTNKKSFEITLLGTTQMTPKWNAGIPKYGKKKVNRG
jgi:hypothetical protein